MNARDKRKAYDRARRASMKAAGINRDAVYLASHREENKARCKAWRAANLDKSRASVKAYRKANPEKATEWSLAWRKRNAARVTARKRAWNNKQYALKPDVFREKAREHSSRRRAQKRQTQAERVDLKQILRDANGLCGICGNPFDLFGIEFDHIVPLSKGGTHTAANIQATHARCNRAKGARVG